MTSVTINYRGLDSATIDEIQAVEAALDDRLEAIGFVRSESTKSGDRCSWKFVWIGGLQ